MADRLDVDKLRPEYRVPAAAPFLLAFLQFSEERARGTKRDRELSESLTILDSLLHLHIFVFEVTRGGGTRASNLVNSTQAPRRTVRDGLSRLAQAGLIVREGDLYYPSAETGRIADERFDLYMRHIGRLCDTSADFRRAIGR